MKDRGFNVKALHGDMTQGSRDGVMLGFKGGRVPILVATDVAARGLDISTVTHVVNYDVPRSPDVYVHRIGRTGRVGRAGRAITFVEPKQEKELEAIEKHVGHHDHARGSPARTSRPKKMVDKPPRHTKPQIKRNGDEPYAKLIVAGGRSAGIEVADLVHAVTQRRRDRRRGGAQRQGARALRVPVGPRRRRRAHRRGDRRRARARPAHPRRAREGLSAAFTSRGPAPRAGTAAPPGGALRSPSMAERNVLGDELEPCGTDPLTGFYRDGCCSTRCPRTSAATRSARS